MLIVVFFLCLEISFYALFVEKSAIILMGLPLCVTHFSFVAFNILSLFCIFNVLIIIYLGVFL
jgi:hypothetical protein